MVPNAKSYRRPVLELFKHTLLSICIRPFVNYKWEIHIKIHYFLDLSKNEPSLYSVKVLEPCKAIWIEQEARVWSCVLLGSTLAL